MIFSCDFETTTRLDDCRVWLWGACDVSENPTFYYYGNDIVSFCEWCSEQVNTILYFHNAKFDTDFIMNHLFRAGFTHIIDAKELTPKTFTTLISDDGKFYSMEICWHNHSKTVIRDSQKLLNMSVERIAKTFSLPESKLEIDYAVYREKGHNATQEEKQYIKADITIVAKALSKLFSAHTDRLTIGSCALHNYMNMAGGKKSFRKIFPVLPVPVDTFCRKAYRGGYVYANPIYKGKDTGSGFVFDVNSLYPWAMHSPNLLPYGKAIYYKGKFSPDGVHNLYIQRISVNFDVKQGYFPTIQMKNNSAFVQTEYVTSSNGEVVTLTLTSIDLELFIDHYVIHEIEYIDGFMFKAKEGMFDGYIDYWTDVKIKAGRDGNQGMRAIAKLYLNSLYGKFATRPTVRSAIPYLHDSGKVAYNKTEYEERETVYSPVGIFITAIARNKTIRSAQQNYSKVAYIDTDSMHIVSDKAPDNIDIDQYRLGAWKLENTFARARFLRAKTYIEDITDSGIKVTCAGLPARCHSQVTWDNFTEGAIYNGKLSPKRVAGGTVLVDTTFEIKP